MSDITQQHQSEVKRGERFEFGKNWANFLRTLTDQKIDLAVASLQDYLGVQSLAGKSFIDIGSGSGLFSLAARKLGAKVRSFDYDPNSYACTTELKRRYFSADNDWTVEQGSVLDKAFMNSLGTYDIVYSWGVLHHTGSMYDALENVKPLVRVGGQLFIAIYNDHGSSTDLWWKIKRNYNRLPRPLKDMYSLIVLVNRESKDIITNIRHRQVREYIRSWTEYTTMSVRGMNRWYDWVDWIGGFPYERATVTQLVDVYAPDGFRLEKLQDSSAGYGCHQLVFRRDAPAGVFVDSVIPGGTMMTRRFGARVLGPFEHTAEGWIGTAAAIPKIHGRSRHYLIRDDKIIIGEATVRDGRVAVAPPSALQGDVADRIYHLVAADLIPLAGLIQHDRGHMWSVPLPKYSDAADSMAAPRSSPMYIFEDDAQLPEPHTIHDVIAERGRGKFSHWSASVHFSALDNSDPTTNGRVYRALVAALPLSPIVALSDRHGEKLTDLRHDVSGWTASGPSGDALWLLVDDRLKGPLARRTDGRCIVAPPETPEAEISTAKLFAVSADVFDVAGPFLHGGGLIWSTNISSVSHEGDTSEAPGRSDLFVFQGSEQLPTAHSSHSDISVFGEGRYSHWGDTLYLSTLDASDPNAGADPIRVLIPRKR